MRQAVTDSDVGYRVSTIARCTGLSETTIRREIRGGRLKPCYYVISLRNGVRMPLMSEAEIIDWLFGRRQRSGLNSAGKEWLTARRMVEWLETLTTKEWVSAVTAEA